MEHKVIISSFVLLSTFVVSRPDIATSHIRKTVSTIIFTSQNLFNL